MDPVAELALLSSLFVAVHLVVSSTAVRPRLIGAIGDQLYRALYSLVAFATLIPLIVVFARHKHAGPILWYLRDYASIRILTWVMMFAALIILVAGFINPSPSAMVAPAGSSETAHGVQKVTRHPAFVAFSLFGFAHILMNGWLGDLFFFGAFPALGILGGMHQDRRKIRDLGDSYRRFAASTSFFPGAALARGLQHWSSEDTPWIAIGIGGVLGLVLAMLHPALFGGSPTG